MASCYFVLLKDESLPPRQKEAKRIVINYSDLNPLSGISVKNLPSAFNTAFLIASLLREEFLFICSPKVRFFSFENPSCSVYSDGLLPNGKTIAESSFSFAYIIKREDFCFIPDNVKEEEMFNFLKENLKLKKTEPFWSCEI